MFVNVESLLFCHNNFPVGSAGSNPSEAWLGSTLETSRMESSVQVLLLATVMHSTDSRFRKRGMSSVRENFWQQC
jgi:hypothetical protein